MTPTPGTNTISKPKVNFKYTLQPELYLTGVNVRALIGNTQIGIIKSEYITNLAAEITLARVSDQYQRNGVGIALYVELYKALKNQGVIWISGDSHSSSAGRIHQRLSHRYGYGYPYMTEVAGGRPYDRRLPPYRYRIG